MKVIENVSALRQESPSLNAAVYVMGTNNIADGGGGIYVFDASSTANDNGSTVVNAEVNGSGRWLLQVSNSSGGSAPSGGVSTATLPLIITGSNIALGTATGPTTTDATSSVTWSPSGAASTGLILQAVAAQSVPMMEVQTSTGAVCFNLPVPTGTLTGIDNNLIGINAGNGLTSGARNFLAGTSAGGAAASGAMSDVVAIGHQAGLLNTSDGNVFIGSSAGSANTSGSNQVVIGRSAGTLMTGHSNTLIGYISGFGITTGIRNVCIGNSAMGNNSGGAAGASNNVAVGNSAGIDNTADENVFIGSFSGLSNTTGSGNVFVGYSSGDSNVGGLSLTLLGANADVNSTGLQGSIGIGTNTRVITNFSFNAGSELYPTNDVYFGKGHSSTSATAYTINGTGGSGTNNAGANLQLAGGKGTGTAEPGLVVLKYPLKTTTGTTLQSLSTQSFPVSVTMLTGNGAAQTTPDSTTAQTTMLNTVSGTQSLEGGLLRVGRQIRIRATGNITTAAAPPTIRFRLNKNTTAIMDTGAITPIANISSGWWQLDVTLHVRSLGASGNIAIQGLFVYTNPANQNAYAISVPTTGAMDTTTTENLDLTSTWGSDAAGASSITTNVVTFEILN